MQTFLLLLRILLGFAGALIFFSGFLLDETEEKKLHNKLEDVWVLIDDARMRAMSRQLAFIHVVAITIVKGIDRLVGTKTISLRSIGISVCFVVSAANLFLLVVDKKGEVTNHAGKMFIGSLLLGLSPALLKSRKQIIIWFVLFAYLSYKIYLDGIIELSYAGVKGFSPVVVLVALSVVVGSCLAAVLLAMSIRLIRSSILKLSQSNSIIGFILTLAYNCYPVLAILPIWWALDILTRFYDPNVENNLKEPKIQILLGVIFLVLMCAIFVLFVFVILFFVYAIALIFSLILLLHKLFWPTISRPVYALQKYNVFQTDNRKYIVAIGAFLLGLAFQVHDWVWELVKRRL